MNIDLLKEILEVFGQADLHKMKLQTENFTINLEKAPVLPPAMPPAQTAAEVPAVQAQIQTTPQEQKSEAGADIPAGTQVKTPLVGVFYTAPTPESKPFVEVGQKVKKGDTLCIVEAMKVMNKIEAPCDGVVTIVFPNNGDMVEFDQILMVIA